MKYVDPIFLMNLCFVSKITPEYFKQLNVFSCLTKVNEPSIFCTYGDDELEYHRGNLS